MSRNKIDIRQEIKKELRSMERFGQSKYDDKKSGRMQSGIYSYSTARAYNRDCQKFADYVIAEHGNRYISLDDAKQYINGYMEREIASGKSAYTLKAERSAIAKLYQVEGKSICELPDRCRADISRSRDRLVQSAKTGKLIKNQSTRSGHFSEKNHQELVNFCKSTGLRRCELESLRGDQLVQTDHGCYIMLTGSQCKGGRDRSVPVISNVANVVDAMQSAGSGRVFDKVPAAMDVHHYRSQYASELYRQIARPLVEVPKSERYYCRGELKGTCYDKHAMLIVSQALGHNRVSVIAGHYLR